MLAVEAIAKAVTSCSFEENSIEVEERVYIKLLEVLLHTIRGQVGVFLRYFCKDFQTQINHSMK